MTDQPNDIDIEAERKLLEDTTTGFDLRRWWHDPTQYIGRRTKAGLVGWLARARLAAERERELQATIDRLEKQVPKPRPTMSCPRCHGAGWFDGPTMCDMCFGAGWVYFVEERTDQ